MLKLAVFGLGYVGCVSTACFARDGHHIIGVDILEEKVRLIGQGKAPLLNQVWLNYCVPAWIQAVSTQRLMVAQR